MADLIDRGKLHNSIMILARHARAMEKGITLVQICDLIQDAPAVDAEPVKRGKWLTCDDGWVDVHYQCSECGQEWCLNYGTPEENGMNYCPHCGAKNVEEKL